MDLGGGAERVARQLFEGGRQLGHESWMAVGKKLSGDPDVFAIKPPGGPAVQAWHRLQGYLLRQFRKRLGHQVSHSPGTWRLLDLAPHRPQIIHAHNLHGLKGGYFDLRALPWLSRQVPFVMTLHDAWLLSGHCAHSFACDRWKSGCGQCPDLTIYPAIRRDATTYNWRRRQEIFAETRLFIATPSHWLMKRVEQSMLRPAITEARVIPNGVDLSIFNPGDRLKARAELKLPPEADVLLFAANGIRNNIWKDYRLLQMAIGKLASHSRTPPLILLALGEAADDERIGKALVRFIPYQSNPRSMAQYYQAADVYLHAAHAEVWGLTITEAMACGCPVVATAVGGIPEQIVEGETGFLTPPGDPTSLAEQVRLLLEDPSLRSAMGTAAAKHARARFSLKQQLASYLDWYETLLASAER